MRRTEQGEAAEHEEKAVVKAAPDEGVATGFEQGGARTTVQQRSWSASPEDDDVLPGQSRRETFKRKSFCLDFRSRLRHTHPMRVGDRKAGVFLAILDEHEAAIRLERAADALEHQLWVSEFVVNVEEQHRDRHPLPAGAHRSPCPGRS